MIFAPISRRYEARQKRARNHNHFREYGFRVCAIEGCGSNPSEQQQDQQDHDDEPKAAAAIISGAVKRSAANAAEAAQQCDNKNNENDRSE